MWQQSDNVAGKAADLYHPPMVYSLAFVLNIAPVWSHPQATEDIKASYLQSLVGFMLCSTAVVSFL